MEDQFRAVTAPLDRLRGAAAERYGKVAAEVIAPVVVEAVVKASADYSGGVKEVILAVASYGRHFPLAAQVAFVERAALALEACDLAAAGWAARTMESAMQVQTDGVAQAERVVDSTTDAVMGVGD
jgi:hypothetical protein